MNEFAQYTERFIPWAEGAEGPDAWDCMAFSRHIQKHHFGIELPRVVIPDYDDSRALVALLNGHGDRQQWHLVNKPQHGDMVLVRTPMHIGTWLDIEGGRVLHCVRGAGVLSTPTSSWHVSGFGRRQYFRHESKI